MRACEHYSAQQSTAQHSAKENEKQRARYCHEWDTRFKCLRKCVWTTLAQENKRYIYFWSYDLSFLPPQHIPKMLIITSIYKTEQQQQLKHVNVCDIRILFVWQGMFKRIRVAIFMPMFLNSIHFAVFLA